MADTAQLKQAKSYLVELQESQRFRSRRIVTQVESAGLLYEVEECHQECHGEHGGPCPLPRHRLADPRQLQTCRHEPPQVIIGVLPRPTGCQVFQQDAIRKPTRRPPPCWRKGGGFGTLAIMQTASVPRFARRAGVPAQRTLSPAEWWGMFG